MVKTLGSEYLVDGITTNRAENGSGGFDGISPSVEAIQEFRVSISALPADIGRTTGGIANFNSRNGTNSYHGIVYNFYKNAALDGNNWFNNHFWQKIPHRPLPSGAHPTRRTITASPLEDPSVFLMSTTERIRHSFSSDGNSFATTRARLSQASYQPPMFAVRPIPISISQASSAGRSQASPIPAPVAVRCSLDRYSIR